MIYPQKNKLITWFFHNYILRIVKRNYHEIKFNVVEAKKDRSVLLLANHFSWWDGFIMYYLNAIVFKKRFHVMVIEETMQQVSFFKYLGAFSVSKNSREMLASLDYAAELLNDPENLVLIFPQGKLYSNFVGDVKFQKGLSKIMQLAGGKFQTIIAATFIENLQYKKPTVNVYIEATGDLTDIQSAYRQHYNNARQQQTQIAI